MRPCQNPVQIFGSPPLSPRLIKKEKGLPKWVDFRLGYWILALGVRDFSGLLFISLSDITGFPLNIRSSSICGRQFFQRMLRWAHLACWLPPGFPDHKQRWVLNPRHYLDFDKKRHCQIGWTGLYNIKCRGGSGLSLVKFLSKSVVPFWSFMGTEI